MRCETAFQWKKYALIAEYSRNKKLKKKIKIFAVVKMARRHFNYIKHKTKYGQVEGVSTYSTRKLG